MSPADVRQWAPMAGIGLAALFMMFRVSRGLKPHPVRPLMMWVIPGILLVGTLAVLSRSPPRLLDSAWILLSVLAGSALGWQRGRLTTITLAPQTGAPMAKASPAAMVFILALMVVRSTLRAAGESQAASWKLDSVLLTELFLGFALGMLCAQRLEMWLRIRRLVARTGNGTSIVT